MPVSKPHRRMSMFSFFRPALSLRKPIMRRAWMLIVVVALAGLVSIQAVAQEASSGINGTITDAGQGVVPKAQVTARNTGTNLTASAMSNANGFFEFPNLPPGRYTLTVTAPGFQTTSSTAFSILTGQRARVDMVLQVGVHQYDRRRRNRRVSHDKQRAARAVRPRGGWHSGDHNTFRGECLPWKRVRVFSQ